MAKKRSKSFGKKKEEKVYNNRLLYSLIALGVLIVVAVGVYALGAIPNPGHSISELQTCGSSGDFLETTNSGWSCVSLSFPGGDIGINFNQNGGGISWGAVSSQIYDGGSPADLHFWTDDRMHFDIGGTPSSPSSSDMLYISSSGVGIGTTSPSYKLDVSGDIRSSGTVYASKVSATAFYGSFQGGYSPTSYSVKDGAGCGDAPGSITGCLRGTEGTSCMCAGGTWQALKW